MSMQKSLIKVNDQLSAPQQNTCHVPSFCMTLKFLKLFSRFLEKYFRRFEKNIKILSRHLYKKFFLHVRASPLTRFSRICHLGPKKALTLRPHNHGSNCNTPKHQYIANSCQIENLTFFILSVDFFLLILGQNSNA
jgi:hypothetical protein